MDIKVVTDASVWVSWLRAEDVNHELSRLWIEQYIFTGGLHVVPTLLLVEVAAAISRRTRQPALADEAVRKVEAAHILQTIQIVPMESALMEGAINVAKDLQLRAGDAIYVALAQQLNIPLVSWDKEQLQRASSVIKTNMPSNFSF